MPESLKRRTEKTLGIKLDSIIHKEDQRLVAAIGLSVLSGVITGIIVTVVVQQYIPEAEPVLADRPVSAVGCSSCGASSEFLVPTTARF